MQMRERSVNKRGKMRERWCRCFRVVGSRLEVVLRFEQQQVHPAGPCGKQRNNHWNLSRRRQRSWKLGRTYVPRPWPRYNHFSINKEQANTCECKITTITQLTRVYARSSGRRSTHSCTWQHWQVNVICLRTFRGITQDTGTQVAREVAGAGGAHVRFARRTTRHWLDRVPQYSNAAASGQFATRIPT